MEPEQSLRGVMLSSRIAIPHIAIAIAGRRAPSYTSFGASSRRVLGFSTALPSRRFELVSCYLQEPGGAVGVSHLQLSPEYADDGVYRIVPSDGLVSVHASWCLLDHVAQLREKLAAHSGADVRVDVADAALDRAAAWSS